MVARGANVSANWSARLWTSSYAMHESNAEWRGARSTAATLELRVSCLMLSVTRAWAVSWNVRSSPSLFLLVARTRDQIRALAVSVRRLSLDISISLSGFRCRTSGNSREFRGGTFNGLKNDFAPLRIPPYHVHFINENNLFTGNPSDHEFPHDACVWYVSCVLATFFTTDTGRPSRKEGGSDEPKKRQASRIR